MCSRPGRTTTAGTSEPCRGAGSVRDGVWSRVEGSTFGSDRRKGSAELPRVVDRDDPGQCRVPGEERGERVLAHGHPSPVQVSGKMQDVLVLLGPEPAGRGRRRRQLEDGVGDPGGLVDGGAIVLEVPVAPRGSSRTAATSPAAYTCGALARRGRRRPPRRGPGAGACRRATRTPVGRRPRRRPDRRGAASRRPAGRPRRRRFPRTRRRHAGAQVDAVVLVPPARRTRSGRGRADPRAVRTAGRPS